MGSNTTVKYCCRPPGEEIERHTHIQSQTHTYTQRDTDTDTDTHTHTHTHTHIHTHTHTHTLSTKQVKRWSVDAPLSEKSIVQCASGASWVRYAPQGNALVTAHADRCLSTFQVALYLPFYMIQPSAWSRTFQNDPEGGKQVGARTRLQPRAQSRTFQRGGSRALCAAGQRARHGPRQQVLLLLYYFPA